METEEKKKGGHMVEGREGFANQKKKRSSPLVLCTRLDDMT